MGRKQIWNELRGSLAAFFSPKVGPMSEGQGLPEDSWDGTFGDREESPGVRTGPEPPSRAGNEVRFRCFFQVESRGRSCAIVGIGNSPTGTETTTWSMWLARGRSGAVFIVQHKKSENTTRASCSTKRITTRTHYEEKSR